MQEHPRDFEPVKHDEEGVDDYDFGPDDFPGVDKQDYYYDLNHDFLATGINHDTGRGRRTRGGHTTPSPTLFRGKFS